MLESILTTNAEGSIKVFPALICVGVAIVLGLIISIIYIMGSKKKRFSRNFAITLVLLPAIVAIVIMLVGSNVARAFSMAGAFALVRFRSVPGDSKDIATVFFAMAVGLAAGLGFVTFAGIVTLLIGVVYYLLIVTKYGEVRNNDKTLKITIPENLNYQGAFDDLFNEFALDFELEKVRTTNLGSMYELTYSVIMKKDVDEKKFIDKIRSRNGNLNIVLCKSDDGVQML